MNFLARIAQVAQKRLSILITSVIITCCVALPAHSSPGFFGSLAFTPSPRGHVLVPVSIDGSEPLVFVLDTAAGKTFVTPSLVDRLGLEKAGVEQAPTMGIHGKTDNEVVMINSLAVGEVQVASIDAIVLDLDHITRGSWHADGVLGMDFLRQFDIRLDFGGKLVSFYSAAPNRSNCTACPADIEGIGFETIDPGFIVLPVTVDAMPVNAVLDSGSGHSGVNVKAATSLGVTLPPMSADAPAGHGFGIQTGPVRLGDVTLTERAPLRVLDHPVMKKLGLADRPSMLMGTDQLVGRTITICYGLETLFVQ